MNRFATILCSLLIMLTSAMNSQASELGAHTKELVLLNWSEYMDPELIKKFEKIHDVTIKQVYFESDDYRDNYMLETQGEGIDLIMVNSINLRLYRQQKWIAPLTKNDVPNLKHIDRKWLTLFKDADGYAVPYFWGTSGVAYRKDLYPKTITGYKDLFRSDETLRGKIAMVASSRDLIGVALKTLGYSINSTKAKELNDAKQILLKQKPYVKDYTYVRLDEKSSLVTGEVIMAMMYSGDALMLQELNENIAYVVPEEGSELWVDQLTVSAASKNKQLAYHFIDFINEPANAAQMALYVYYATPNLAAEKLLPKDFKADKTIYPPESVLDKCEVYTRLTPRATRIRNEIFSTIIR